MSSAIDIAATAVTPPGEVYVRTTSATAEVLQLTTADWNNHWITVQAVGEDVYVKFSTTSAGAGTLDPAALSGATTPVTAAAGGGLHIPTGTTREFYLRDFVSLADEEIFMAHRSAGATGTVRFYRSSGRRSL
jgi:hypothetical protein